MLELELGDSFENNSNNQYKQNHVLFEDEHYVNSCFSVPHHCVNWYKVLPGAYKGRSGQLV